MNRLMFKKVNGDAVLPTKNNSNDTGYDVYSVEDTVVPSKGSCVVDVGLKFAYIEDGFWVKVEGRSGLGFKHGILPHPGIIDCGYRGDAGIKLYNLSDKDYNISKGDRIAQFVLYKNHTAEVGWSEIEYSERGDKGFGSSGK